ncbi:TIGR02594 family protein [Rubritalea squalenifaciens DSM 18772]|uniref:TIGR02594 family protein n=1 Tax=Rubritalea squalenifaciens DSM 18772 TaxID=1123071 RepID=A0A1M6CQQ3_9BACT|nr:TIGR02594 family protein [Rubritalea squalenifaciens]SHI63181.1 TIGR02594 family protein [Rubritalea squalenifaciens DSM 18772]
MKIPKTIDTRAELAVYLQQYALREHGFDPGPLDGIEGVRTRAALADACQQHLDAAGLTKVPAYAERAQEYLGLSEVPGAESNRTILGWIRSFFSWAKDDGELAWCAIFINTMLAKSGIRGTGSAAARSFLQWGEPVEKPRKGDIVVFWRGSRQGWQGHVGLYWGEAGSEHIYCLGGNQANRVSIAKYPRSRVLGYRREAGNDTQ